MVRKHYGKMLVTSNPAFKPLPKNKILDVTKLKAFADKLNVASLMISLLDRVENTVEKGENAGYQHFLLFQQFFFQIFLLQGR